MEVRVSEPAFCGQLHQIKAAAQARIGARPWGDLAPGQPALARCSQAVQNTMIVSRQ